MEVSQKLTSSHEEMEIIKDQLRSCGTVHCVTGSGRGISLLSAALFIVLGAGIITSMMHLLVMRA